MIGRTAEPMRILLSIIEQGSGWSLLQFLKKRQIHMHLQATAQGTASSEMMDILGLGSSDKDVLISFATEKVINRLTQELSDNLKPISRGRGIMMILSPSAMSNLFATIVTRQTDELPAAEGVESMKNEYKHSLICIAVDQGYTDDVMAIAKKAGATGGTVFRAHLAGSEEAEKQGIVLQEEREIVTILAPDSIRDKIMERVNEKFGLRTEAGGILCALPVDKAYKL